MEMNRIYLSNNLPILQSLKDESIDLIYIDPPFNTKKKRTLTHLKTEQNNLGDRTGFQNKRYKTTKGKTREYDDIFDDYISFLRERIVECYRILKPTGSFFLHLDYREVHYAKVLLDNIFGRECFMNEIIWSFDFGGRAKKKWPTKHNNILWYVKNPKHYTFNYDQMDRLPYLAPGLVGPEKAKIGKTPTSCWWGTIVPTNSKERKNYPTQKPLWLLERIIKIHSNPGDLILDCFAGSGTTGEAAAKHGRKFILIDDNPEAVAIMKERLSFANTEIIYEEMV